MAFRRRRRIGEAKAAMFPADFPRRLERLREASGLTWREFAGSVDVSVRTVHRWRRGVRPDAAHLLALFGFAAQRDLLHRLMPLDQEERRDERQALIFAEEEWGRLAAAGPQPATGPGRENRPVVGTAPASGGQNGGRG
jgi:transcriptional regulator with XRE-family HTH domain